MGPSSLSRVSRLVVSAAVVAGCAAAGGGPPASDSSTSATAADSVEVVEPALAGVPVVMARTGVAAAAVVTPEAGGELSVELAPGITATLEVPAGALAMTEIVELLAIGNPENVTGETSGLWASTTAVDTGVVGVAIEPAGLWLERPARLSLSASEGQVLARVGPLDWYAPVRVGADGTIPVLRLRPFVLDPQNQLATDVPTGSWDDDVLPYFGGQSTDPGLLGIDALDQAARNEEADAADGDADDGSSQEHRDEVVDEARRVVESLTPACNDDPVANRRVVEALRTGGAARIPPPECIKLRIKVYATVVGEVVGPDLSGFSLEERVLSTTDGFAQDGTARFSTPLTGQLAGYLEFVSLFRSGFAWGFGEASGLPAPAPSADACTSANSVDGVMLLSGGALVIEVDPLPDERLRVTVVPEPPGDYLFDCGRGTESTPSFVWEALSGITGSPIRFEVTKGQPVERVLSQFEDRAAQGVVITDGTAVITDSQSRTSVTFYASVSFADPTAST